MTPFVTVAMVPAPRERVWAAIRDRLPSLSDRIEDIAGIDVIERREEDGIVHLVNLWRASTPVPTALHRLIRPEDLAWIDRAQWEQAAWTCRWRIEPRILPDKVRCDGQTRFEEAMGGRGTRLTFEGSFEVAPGDLPGVPSLLRTPVVAAVEALVGGTIPRSFRKMVQVVEKELKATPAA